MSEDYERQADAAEQELEQLERRTGELGDEIDETRKDWEAKKEDPGVPGAGGDPEHAEEGGRHPETAYPAKGPDDELATEDPADNDRGTDDSQRDDDESERDDDDESERDA